MALKEAFSYSEESDYEKGEGSIKEIVLRHIRKISDLSCQELTSRYYQEKPVKVGDSFTIIRIYHPDLKEAYCNAIEFLIDLLYPRGDPSFKEFMDIFQKEVEGLKDSERLKKMRLAFQEVNKMFERTKFFEKGDTSDE